MVYPLDSKGRPLETFDSSLVSLQATLQRERLIWNAGAYGCDRLVNTWMVLRQIHNEAQAILGLPRIVERAKDWKDDQTFDIVTELTQLSMLLDDAATEARSLIPKDQDNYCLHVKLPPSGRLVQNRTIAKPQTRTLDAKVSDVLAFIV